MPVQVELRERVYHFLFLRKPKPQHGHAVEYTVELLYVLANCTFLAGSICFFSSDLMVIGAILFLAGSLVFTVLSALNVCEQRAYQAHYESDAQLLSAGAAGPSSEQGTAERLLENGCYFLGSIAFVAGSPLRVRLSCTVKLRSWYARLTPTAASTETSTSAIARARRRR